MFAHAQSKHEKRTRTGSDADIRGLHKTHFSPSSLAHKHTHKADLLDKVSRASYEFHSLHPHLHQTWTTAPISPFDINYRVNVFRHLLNTLRSEDAQSHFSVTVLISVVPALAPRRPRREAHMWMRSLGIYQQECVWIQITNTNSDVAHLPMTSLHWILLFPLSRNCLMVLADSCQNYLSSLFIKTFLRPNIS